MVEFWLNGKTQTIVPPSYESNYVYAKNYINIGGGGDRKSINNLLAFWRKKLILLTLLWSTNVVQNSGTNIEGSEAGKGTLIINMIHFYLTFHISLEFIIQKWGMVVAATVAAYWIAVLPDFFWKICISWIFFRAAYWFIPHARILYGFYLFPPPHCLILDLYFQCSCHYNKKNVHLHFKIEFLIFIFPIEKRKW